MMLARVCRTGVSPNVALFLKTPVAPKTLLSKIQPCRLYASERNAFGKASKSITERIFGKSGEKAYTFGQQAVIASTLVGAGALCTYGLGLSSQVGAIDEVRFFPKYVKERIKATYMYVAASAVVTAGSAVMCMRSPAVMRLVTQQGWLAMAGMIAVVIGSGSIVRSIPYKEGFGAKQLAWMTHCGILGALIAPACFLGGPMLIKAAWSTAGAVAGLSTIAWCAPNEKFLNWAAPIGLGCGVILATMLASPFVPVASPFRAPVNMLLTYGAVLLFSAKLLYDTQRFVRIAEQYPVYHHTPYDPINMSLSVYMDILNIFISLLNMNAMNRKK